MIAEQLGAILVNTGKLTGDQLRKAVALQKGTGRLLGDILLEMALVSPADIAGALAEQLQIPNLSSDDILQRLKGRAISVPESVARKYALVACEEPDGDVLTVVMVDPLDVDALDAVRSLVPLSIRRAVATEADIFSVIDRLYGGTRHAPDGRAADRPMVSSAAGNGDDDVEALGDAVNEGPVVRFVHLLLMQAVRDRASDVHFEPGDKGPALRLRVDGVLRDVTPPPRTLYPSILARIKFLANMDLRAAYLPSDGRFTFDYHGRIIDIHVSAVPQVRGEKLVLRILDREALLIDLREIGFEDTQRRFERFLQILRLANGVILVTGPSGSGKTSTLYGALNLLKSRERNIHTIEDPVEYDIGDINQMQVRPQAGLDFAGALRAVLRQDADVILVGEIRDAETARLAMRAALTGKLVLSTLHTGDATSAYCRLREIGVEPYLIASSVKAVLAQRLVRVICQSCKSLYEPPEDILRIITAVCPQVADWQHYHGDGCGRCAQTGYAGRQGIFEFVETSEPVRQMILERIGEAAFRRRCVEEGMETLRDNGFAQERRGVTTLEEVMSVCPIADLV
jgi:type IV pilus assembly protein PilB